MNVLCDGVVICEYEKVACDVHCVACSGEGVLCCIG